jgi:hypothetical protein
VFDQTVFWDVHRLRVVGSSGQAGSAARIITSVDSVTIVTCVCISNTSVDFGLLLLLSCILGYIFILLY